MSFLPIGFVQLVLLGDFDADQAVTVRDAIQLTEYLDGTGPAPVCLAAVDANRDSLLGLEDVSQILRWAAGIEAPPGDTMEGIVVNPPSQEELDGIRLETVPIPATVEETPDGEFVVRLEALDETVLSGPRAADARVGFERLPGANGRLIEFYAQTRCELGRDLRGYLVASGRDETVAGRQSGFVIIRIHQLPGEEAALTPPRLCDRAFDDLVASGADSSMPDSYSPYRTFRFRVEVESSSIAILRVKLSYEAIDD